MTVRAYEIFVEISVAVALVFDRFLSYVIYCVPQCFDPHKDCPCLN